MDYRYKYIKYKYKYIKYCNKINNIINIQQGGKKIIDLIQYKLSPLLEEIKGDKKVTIETVVSNCNKTDIFNIKWINRDNIIFPSQ